MLFYGRNAARYFNPLPPHGGDPLWFYTPSGTYFNPLLRMEGDSAHGLMTAADKKFQSTPSAWRETFCSAAYAADRPFQSTPSAWRETNVLRQLHPVRHISIHSLRMEGDPDAARSVASSTPFQSTPSAWRETYRLCFCDGVILFQSTPSAWRETAQNSAVSVLTGISIHSLRMEGDGVVAQAFRDSGTFQSTPSAWRETPKIGEFKDKLGISIHSLRMEGDQMLLLRRCSCP